MKFKFFLKMLLLTFIPLSSIQAYKTEVYYLREGKNVVGVRGGQYVKVKRMGEKGQDGVYWGEGIGEVLVQGEEMLLIVGVMGEVEVLGPGVVTVYSGVQGEVSMGFIGHSYEYTQNGITQFRCNPNYTGKYCLLPITPTPQSLSLQSPPSPNHPTILKFTNAIQLTQTPKQTKISYCHDQTLQKCREVVENQIIDLREFFIVVDWNMGKMGNLRNQGMLRWVYLVDVRKGPVFLKEGEGWDRGKVGGMGVFALIVLIIIKKKYFQKTIPIPIVPNKDSQNKQIPVSQNQNK